MKPKKLTPKFEVVAIKHPTPVGSRKAFMEKVENSKYPARLKQSTETEK